MTRTTSDIVSGSSDSPKTPGTPSCGTNFSARPRNGKGQESEVPGGKSTWTLAFPTDAIGRDRSTNFSASEKVTRELSDGVMVVVTDIGLSTTGNTFEFVGFPSERPIVQVAFEPSGGQNGITSFQPPYASHHEDRIPHP